MTGVVILNWNGFKDTIDCLRSLYKIEDTEFFIILVDNGSTNGSVKEIEKFQRTECSTDFYIIKQGGENELPNSLENKSCVLYCLDENYGFAKGNNLGLSIAKTFNPEFLLMLNNDTEVEPNFLSELIHFNHLHPEFIALCPKISLYYKPGYIWNCGGSLKWGFRRYHYAGKPETSIKEKEYIEAEYVTGCAFFFKTSLLNSGPLLTERFFHGEEDFELGYRFKRLNYRMACVLSSHIYHKVGVATKNLNNIGKIYCYYLLRFIDMRQQMPTHSYIMWRIVYSFYLIIILRKANISLKTRFNFIRKLFKESTELEEVNKKKFFELLERGI